tara:strand:- start:15728 stop:17671 length:1944 start_codon:yes stop_codon:yes gene_type:complete
MIQSDKKENNFQHLKEIKQKLNASITPTEKNYFERVILKGENSSLNKKLKEAELEISKIPLSTFDNKNKILSEIDQLTKTINNNPRIKIELQELDKKLISFYKLVGSNKWNNLLKITNGAIERLKKVKKSSKLIDTKRNIDLLEKDFNLIYRVAEVSTLSQAKKEIIKKRVNTLKDIQINVTGVVDQKIVLLKDLGKLLQGIANLTKEIGVIKNNNVLAIHERSFVIKRMLWFYSGITLIFIITFLFLINRDSKVRKTDFQNHFWHIIKNHILTSGKEINDDSLDNKFLSEINDCRNYIRGKELYGELLKESLERGALIFQNGGELVWSNDKVDQFLHGDVVKNYSHFINLFNISNIISTSEGYSLSVEMNDEWVDIIASQVNVDNQIYYVVFLSKKEVEPIDKIYEKNLIEVERSLDEILNKNESIALDSFVQQSESLPERVESKARRLAHIFSSFEKSILEQMRVHDDNHMDNIKVINDTKKIIDSTSLVRDLRTNEIKNVFMSLSRAIEKLKSAKQKQERDYGELRDVNLKNIKKVEFAVEELLKIKDSSTVLKDEFKNLINELASVEIHSANDSLMDSTGDLESLEEHLADLMGSHFKGVEKLEQILSDLGEILSENSKTNSDSFDQHINSDEKAEGSKISLG